MRYGVAILAAATKQRAKGLINASLNLNVSMTFPTGSSVIGTRQWALMGDIITLRISFCISLPEY